MFNEQDLRDTVRDNIELLKKFPPSDNRDVIISVGEAFLREKHMDAVDVLEWMHDIREIVESRRKKRKTV